MIRFYFHPTPNPAKVALLLYLAEKSGKFLGKPEDRPELLSWLLFVAFGLGPFSGQAVHFQFAAPEGLNYAVNRYRREAERHYQVLNDHLAGRNFIVGDSYTIADISASGWLDRGTQSTLTDLLCFETEAQAGEPIDDVRKVSNYVDAMMHTSYCSLRFFAPTAARIERPRLGRSTKNPGTSRLVHRLQEKPDFCRRQLLSGIL
ncbi:MAG: glutathione S-transferase C-terminal domain-containing protein [Roseiarcus sp.]